jgi:AraC-like DNA-binding protein
MHHWERTPQHLRTGPDDDLWLGFLQNGYGQLEQGGRQAVLGSDNLMLYDASQTFRFSLGGNDNHLVRIPRHLLTMRLTGVENLTAIVLDDLRPGVIPLREMLRQVVTAPPILQNTDFSTRFSQTLLDLLALSLEVQNFEKANDERDLYSRIMIYIQKHLTDQELSIEQIANFHNVSTRTVTRAFARHQKTPMAVLWQERLLASRNAIERGHARSVSQVALDYGFSDFSHFSHAFRKAFGVSPQTILRRD